MLCHFCLENYIYKIKVVKLKVFTKHIVIKINLVKCVFWFLDFNSLCEMFHDMILVDLEVAILTITSLSWALHHIGSFMGNQVLSSRSLVLQQLFYES